MLRNVEKYWEILINIENFMRNIVFFVAGNDWLEDLMRQAELIKLTGILQQILYNLFRSIIRKK